MSVAAERYAALVEANAAPLLRYFLGRLDVREDAADLLADTFLVLWRRLDSVPQDAIEARMWLFGVASRTLSTYWRGRRRHLALGDRLRSELATSTGDADAAPAVTDALTRLDSLDQEIIRLVHWDGFSQEQAAVHLGKPAGTIRSRYHRARQRLRSALDPITRPDRARVGPAVKEDVADAWL